LKNWLKSRFSELRSFVKGSEELLGETWFKVVGQKYGMVWLQGPDGHPGVFLRDSGANVPVGLMVKAEMWRVQRMFETFIEYRGMENAIKPYLDCGSVCR
jgi:hypothetical protein